ncbi:MAG: hypothetical protein AAFY99_03520 [Pseudomonadota bacterium]
MALSSLKGRAGPTRFDKIGGYVAVGAIMTATGWAYASDATLVMSDEEFENRYSSAAVSELNGKLEFGYLYFDFEDNTTTTFTGGDAAFAQGAVSMPVTERFGVQIDAGYLNGAIDRTSGFDPIDVSAFAIGGHLFWRDPTVGLLGVYGHYANYDYGTGTGLGTIGVTNTRVAAEGEAYLGKFTAKALAGADFLDVENVGQEEYLLLSGEIGYYFTDNFRVYGGVDHSFNQTAGVFGAEAMFDMGGISPAVFASATISDDTTLVKAGLSVYFGSNSKSLIRRHREDDPGVDLFDTALQTCLEGIAGLDVSVDPRSALDRSALDKRIIRPIRGAPVDLSECEIGATFDSDPRIYTDTYPYTYTLVTK